MEALTAEAVTLGSRSDGVLVAAVRRGDDGAFEELYSRYQRRITAYVYGMVSDHARAEDITQDVFISALRRMRETERPIAFRAWIYEIAKNACIDAYRRSSRAEEVSYDAEELAPADAGRLVTAGGSPDAVAEGKEQLDHLCGAFGGLSETHHQILVLRELEGLSYREIGEQLGMSRAAVESTLFRARRRLTEEYDELVSGERCRRVQDILTAAGATLPGARDQRRISRHLAHCQACRRHAGLLGLDVAALAQRSLRSKIAALLPLPFFFRGRRMGADPLSSSSGSAAQWGAQLGTQVDPLVSWAQAAAVAATVAVATIGAGAVSQRGDDSPDPSGPAVAAVGSPRSSGSGADSPATRSADRTSAAQRSRAGAAAPAAGGGGGGAEGDSPSSGGGSRGPSSDGPTGGVDKVNVGRPPAGAVPDGSAPNLSLTPVEPQTPSVQSPDAPRDASLDGSSTPIGQLGDLRAPELGSFAPQAPEAPAAEAPPAPAPTSVSAAGPDATARSPQTPPVTSTLGGAGSFVGPAGSGAATLLSR